LQNGCQKLRINLVGHVCVFVGCVCHPNRKPHWPAPGELRASPFRGRLRSARYARLRSAAPGRGAQIAKNQITEQTLHRLPRRSNIFSVNSVRLSEGCQRFF
jgi:hypothetical protein